MSSRRTSLLAISAADEPHLEPEKKGRRRTISFADEQDRPQLDESSVEGKDRKSAPFVVDAVSLESMDEEEVKQEAREELEEPEEEEEGSDAGTRGASSDILPHGDRSRAVSFANSVDGNDGSGGGGGGGGEEGNRRERSLTVTRIAERINATPILNSVRTRFETSRGEFVRCGWASIVSHSAPLEDAVLVEKKGGKGVLTLESGRVLKRRFESFNNEFEELTAVERSFAVPDSVFRSELRQCIAEQLLPQFSAFFDKYSKVQFSKKHMAEYTRITPNIARAKIEQLFAGL